MLSKTVKDLLNAQVNAELYSAYLYLDFLSRLYYTRLENKCKGY